MTALWIAVGVTVAVGIAIAGVAAWLLAPSRHVPTSLIVSSRIDATDMEPLIEYAAERWATAHGRPEAAGLVAGKLRTLYGLTYDRPVVAPRTRWWSR